MIEKEILKKIILEQSKFENINYIKREKLKILNEKSKSPFVIIISGIRRCGKSTLLNIFRNTQKEKNYYLNFDDERLHNFSLEDFEKLYELFIEIYGLEKTFYFDEIQNILGWEKFIRRISDAKNKIYITGSNSSMLSKELGTHLTGRYIQIELYPCNFKEYLTFKKIKLEKNDFYIREKTALIKKEFLNYLKDGGFLQYLLTQEKDFFKLLYDNIVYRDIITRYKISHEKGIRDIFYYLISNISKEFSYTSLKSISNIASVTTIKDYLYYLENSYLLFTITKYNVSLKKQLINPKKVYSIDLGLANSISFKFSEDYGRVLENLVFIELKRRGEDIYFHKEKKECDFLIRKGYDIFSAIQVCKSLYDPITKKREIEGLLDALDAYNLKTGLILTEDEEGEEIINNKKIIIKSIWRWLLEK